MDNHFIVEPAAAGRLRISLHLTIADTAITIATHTSNTVCSTMTMHDLQEDLLLQTMQRLRHRLEQLRQSDTPLL